MITETKTFYRGTSNETGLEILIFAWYLDPTEGPTFIFTDDSGQVMALQIASVRLNWRWDQAKHDWVDTDNPGQFSTGDDE